MASCNLLAFSILLLAAQLDRVVSQKMYPFNCSQHINTCYAYLYHINHVEQSLSEEQIANFYSVNISQLSPVYHVNRKDYLIRVSCSCQTVNGTKGYFYDTIYPVQPNDTFLNISDWIYSGQAWFVGDEGHRFDAGTNFTMSLVCGCVETDSQVVVTYTVQQHDTLTDVANLLSATIDGIQKMNSLLAENPNSILTGSVLYVPKELNGIPVPLPMKASAKNHIKRWKIIIIVLSTVSVLLIAALIIILLMRDRSKKRSEEDPKPISKSMSTTRASSLRYRYEGNVEDKAAFESERPVVHDTEEIEEATSNFDESKKIGEGGYGSVYFGVLNGQEVAIKKMKSNKSKEFFAELKVLCKIHHIHVVELLGYATGDDHFYLVYEYVRNGSLSDHLHDPLLKGYQPLSWTARTQIALDSAKGIEYIHDHTKARYVHRDIKSSNILLDDRLRAKVADFGLAKLVERNDEDQLILTRLVGTPGYLPPESVKELQVTTKTDVFAFGVVLAELITGQRALSRDNREPTKMKSLITVVYRIFHDDDPEAALEDVIDTNLHGSYPIEDVYKMAEIAHWCLSDEALDRPEMRQIVGKLSHIATSSVEWEASLGGSSQVFSGVFNGR